MNFVELIVPILIQININWSVFKEAANRRLKVSLVRLIMIKVLINCC